MNNITFVRRTFNHIVGRTLSVSVSARFLRSYWPASSIPLINQSVTDDVHQRLFENSVANIAVCPMQCTALDRI